MYYKISDFENDWIYESESTLKLLRNLTDDSLSQKVTNDGRSLGFLAWHITGSISEMMNRTGLKIEVADEHCEPEQAQIIIDTYARIAESCLKQVRQKWTDEKLLEENEMYGEKWSIGKTLSVIGCSSNSS